MKSKLEKIEQIKKLLKEADSILIGAGSGLSTAAGMNYTGKRFTDHFAEFIKKYHFTDLYTSSFFPFPTEEEKWAYWAKHMAVNCIEMEATKLYQDLLEIVKGKNYFVITTNMDEQFYKAGFAKENIFATQGSYRYIQCSKACHVKRYDATEMVTNMIKYTKDCKIPTDLIPVCPICGEKMEPNLRKDAYFVQDDDWYQQSENYDKWLTEQKEKKVLLWELGVGFNTPGIIRFPFEEMVSQNEKWTLVRVNQENCMNVLEIKDKSILLQEDIQKIISNIK